MGGGTLKHATQYTPEAIQDLRRRYLEPGEERDSLLLEHPFSTDRAYLFTTPIEAAFSEIATCIRYRDSARLFVAKPRTGKTYAIELLQRGITDSFRNVVIISINAKKHDKNSEKAFFGDLLQDLNLPFEDKTTAPTRRLKLLQNVKARCNEMSSSQIVMLVDEGQNWQEEEFTFLRDVSNDLAKFDAIILMVVIFAQPEISALRAKLKTKNRTDLIGRYLRDPITLPGVGNRKTIEMILAQCDDPEMHEYPIYSAISLSEFMLPNAYAAGWRLSKETALLWRILLKLAGAKGNDNISIGMAWIMNSIKVFMFEAIANDSADFSGSSKSWEIAVASGRFNTLI